MGADVADGVKVANSVRVDLGVGTVVLVLIGVAVLGGVDVGRTGWKGVNVGTLTLLSSVPVPVPVQEDSIKKNTTRNTKFRLFFRFISMSMVMAAFIMPLS